ncbi:1,4-beta-D-glucan glucohydrolase [Photobacterium gaetbulicola]|uniref:Putative glucan 1,4-beta-glucosidase n=1 Tax=Photobacterium gaetbulicola Gung47 TaxID=658445 RepID=A0A0C5WGG6_9GAMM|nr:glycoside hydrolase family 3 protein [Photobacterium gaetbulicola]AJR06228.1 putative glucan 1,4-beta-glucosidase [Photobacterium gaetbulicola Gung47]PSU08823.1 1,4-beta-D-glucan glucohydrolase [Photobacterium gaetbulicola]
MRHNKKILPCLIALALIAGCNESNNSNTNNDKAQVKVPYFGDWPVIKSAIEKDQNIENKITEILAQMTLEEKVGQMIQPNLLEVTPEEAAEYKLGSLLNGGGAWPNEDKYSSAEDWAKESDKYWLALEGAYENRGFRIPFMWATDAVHGHNNVFRATVFPHNIGLGAANNPDLIYRIGQATAVEIAATGLDWTFAPTVASPRDYRWGRVYEGYSEDPEIIYQYAGKMVEGIQGGAAGLASEHNVISNVKHWVGDGGTMDGVDRGENHYTEEYLRNIHATGYFAGLNAGAQVVMSSFNSWHADANYDQTESGEYNKKIHGSKYLITDVLKNKMGFDGIVVTDWNGQGEINGCSASNCPEAVNAGNDVFMVTANSDWKAFYDNVIAQVNDGTIAMTRIDDAVSRILRVKLRANLWEKPMPSERALAGQQELLGSAEHRALAREAVSQSLVLLKNEGGILPLSQQQKILVAGSAVNDIQKQTGGWSLTWQGNENTIEQDFPGATTMQMALAEMVGAENIITDLADATEDTIAVVVIGEEPYAEMFGDIKSNKTLEFSSLKASYKDDLDKVKELKAAGLKVVTVFYSGRPLYVNEEINNSDAFVAAWLPGTEAGGITDVLFNKDGKDFTGRLSYSWPMKKCSTAINRVAPNIADYVTPATEQDITGEHKPLFPYGYGLSYESDNKPGYDLANLPLDPRDYGCGQEAPDNGVATTNLEIYGAQSGGEFVARIGGPASGWAGIAVSNGSETTTGSLTTKPINYQHQQDAINVTFDGSDVAQVYLQTLNEKAVDKNAYMNADSTLQFDIKMHQAATDEVTLAMHCEWPCLGDIKINDVLPPVSEDWTTMKFALSCFAEEGMEFSMLNTPFLLTTAGSMQFDLGEIRFVPRSLDAANDEVDCAALAEPPLPPLDEAISNIWSDTWNPSVGVWSAHTGTDWSPAPDHVSATESVDGDGVVVVSVSYNPASPVDDKAVVFLVGETQNLVNYVDTGSLEFDLYVDSYGENIDGLVIKMESTKENSGSPDHFLGEIPTGAWTSISVPVSDLGIGEIAQSVDKPFAILPAWANSQAGVAFSFKNVRLVK